MSAQLSTQPTEPTVVSTVASCRHRVSDVVRVGNLIGMPVLHKVVYHVLYSNATTNTT